MTRSMMFLFMALTCVLLLGACGDSDENNPVLTIPVLTTLSESDNGRTVELQVGDKLDVTLNENPSTGFTWEIGSVDEAIIKQVGESEFKPGTGIGASGQRTFHFEAVASGQSDLQLVYHRPFETNAPPSSTFEVTIIVK